MGVRRVGRVGVGGFLRFLAAAAVAAALGLASGLPVVAMGLVVPIQVVGPLASAVGALSAALGAAWVANLFARDRGRLLPVVGVAGATAASLVLLALSLYLLPIPGLDPLSGSLLRTAVVCAGVVAVNAGLAAVRLRGPRGRLGADGTAALLLSVAGFGIGLSAGGVLPWVPDREFMRLGYGALAWIGLAFTILGVVVAVLRSRRVSSGHELGRDAATTLALVAAMLPAVVGSISFACSNLVGCGA